MATYAAWGEHEILIVPRTYQAPGAEQEINEMDLLPVQGQVSTSLQTGPMRRKRIRFRGYVQQWSDFESLHNDLGTTATFSGPDNVVMLCALQQCGPPERIASNYILYQCVLVEA